MLGERWTEAQGRRFRSEAFRQRPDCFPVNHSAGSSQSGQSLREGRVPPGSGGVVGVGIEGLAPSAALRKAMAIPCFLISKLPNCICFQFSLFSTASEMNC